MKKRRYNNNANLKQYADRFKAEHPLIHFSTRPMEHCIVYFSSSISLFYEADLVPLLQQSQSHNAATGITGILLINEGSIVQVLEGKQESIESLYRLIKEDQRHTNVIKVVDCQIEERLFTGWSMGCKSITKHQLELIKTIIDLGRVDWLLTRPSTNSIVNLLKSAYQSDLHYLQQVDKPIVPNLLRNHIEEWREHYNHLAQAIQSIESEFTNQFGQSGELNPVLLEVNKEQRIGEITYLFESNRLSIWERQQRELSQNFILI